MRARPETYELAFLVAVGNQSETPGTATDTAYNPVEPSVAVEVVKVTQLATVGFRRLHESLSFAATLVSLRRHLLMEPPHTYLKLWVRYLHQICATVHTFFTLLVVVGFWMQANVSHFSPVPNGLNQNFQNSSIHFPWRILD